jgi:small-conductance mechanosensitive channel
MFRETLFELGPYNFCFWNIIFLAIIIFGASLLRRFIHKLLKRLLSNANIRVDGQKITWLRLLSQAVYAFAFYIAVLSFKINNENVTFSDFLDYKYNITKKFNFSFYHILTIIAIYFGAKIMVNLTKLYISKKFKENSDLNLGSEYVYVQLAKYVIYIFSFFFCLKALEIEIAILLTGSAALLVGVGLGLQDVFKDMFSGIILLFEGNVKVGDIVEMSNSGMTEPIIAKILRINIRTTQIETREGNVLIIPNNKLTQEHVENWSHGSELSRFKVFVNISYGANTELVSRLLTQAAMSHPKVKKSQPVIVRLANFGENGMEMELLFWADQSWDINNYKSEIRMEIDRLFREYKIVIPFQQRDIHIVNKEVK